MKSAGAHIGCSGWSYEDWRGRFYPRDLPASEWFGYYAGIFDTVEINNSFYRLPTEEMVQAWKDQAPARFLYAFKGSRYLTHMKKLKEAADPLTRIIGRARILGDHLGPILYQLPPRWHYNRERIAAFLALLPPKFTHVIELRDESWYNDELFSLLEEHGVSYCSHDMKGLPPLRRIVGAVAYVRFHGTGEKYHGGYDRETLASWRDWIGEAVENGHAVYAYFNNDYDAQAIRDAITLKEMLAGE